MSRLHDALRRASDGKAPILPAGAGEQNGEGQDAGQSVFSVPWSLDTGSAEGAGASADRAVQAAAADQPGAGFRLSVAGRAGSVSTEVEEKLVGSAAYASNGRFGLVLERYRKLAATLHHAQAERGLKLVLVTSASPGDGKSLNAANLAITLSESYQRRVLLVDGDLRRPSLHELFGAPNESGLSDGLAGASARGLSLIAVSPRLSLLPSGRVMEDPTTALSSPQMREVLEFARAAFDWIVIDTPPVGLMTDAKLLAAMVDGIVLVVGAGSTSYQDALRAIDALGRERLLGAVLNRVSDVSDDAKYYRDYYAHDAPRRT
jgi:capsular exopolysaccharide synthesis family protein